jgi:hypothetical protein
LQSFTHSSPERQRATSQEPAWILPVGLLAHLSLHLFWILSGTVTDDRIPSAQFPLTASNSVTSTLGSLVLAPNPVVADTNSVSRYKQESFMDPETREELFQHLREILGLPKKPNDSDLVDLEEGTFFSCLKTMGNSLQLQANFPGVQVKQSSSED